ncbi:MAG: radical SAM protein [Candidatus Methanomethylicaceae archaeon]
MKREIVYAEGISTLSLSDYIGEPACVIFLSGCNFDCGYCQNWRLKRHSEEQAVDIEEIKTAISKNNLITACKITGGEPLLQLEAVLELGSFVKSRGLKFGIDTNGSLPDALAKVLPLLDLVSIDVKTALEEDAYRRITGLKTPPVQHIIKSLELAMRSSAFVDLRIVIIPGYNDDIDTIKSITKKLRNIGYERKASEGMASLTLVEFVPENAYDENFRKIKSPSVQLLRYLAKESGLEGVRVTHRAVGFYQITS